jgi:hypothetical protein
MSMQKTLLTLCVITGMAGCTEHSSFSEEGFIRTTTFLWDVPKVEKCVFRKLKEDHPEFYVCIEVIPFDGYREIIRAEILAGPIEMTPEGNPIARTQAELDRIENDDSIPIGTLIKWEPEGSDSEVFFKKGQ